MSKKKFFEKGKLPIDLIFKVKKGESAFAPKQPSRYVLAKKMPHPFLSLRA